MRISCPHCHHHIDIVGVETDVTTQCPACGSKVSVVLDTQTFRRPPVEFVSGFDFLENVGMGHFGAVWKGRDRKLDRIVAIKVPRVDQIDGSTVGQFVREARAASQLNHPRIVSVHDVIYENGKLCIVSEFVQGVALSLYLKEYKFSPREAAEFCAEVGDALQHAHDRGVIHRDLKPANILIDGARQPHITDFGLAKRDSDEITVTVDGQILGTPAYMSPEQAAGKAHQVDGRSDVYALGVILYEMLVGKPPFRGESGMLTHQILYEEPKRLRLVDAAVPRDLETICLKALGKEPQRRYATAADMAEDLRRFVRGEPIMARPVSRIERGYRWCRRNPLVASLWGAVFVAAMSIGSLVLSRPSAPPSPLQTVHIATEPAQAELNFFPLDPYDGQPRLLGKVSRPGKSTKPLKLAPGNYLVSAVLPNGDFHEVFRIVPPKDTKQEAVYFQIRYPHRESKIASDGSVELPPIRIPATSPASKGMVLVKGTERFTIGRANDQIERSVRDFYLDATEVTVADFRTFFPTHSAVGASANPDNYPVTNITLDDAIAYAEKVGKIVATETMHEYVATNSGQSRFPWGDDVERITSWELRPVGEPDFDQVSSYPSLRGLWSNALEWTTDPALPIKPRPGVQGLGAGMVTVRGGTSSVQKQKFAPIDARDGARTRFGRPLLLPNPMVGFRCARSTSTL